MRTISLAIAAGAVLLLGSCARDEPTSVVLDRQTRELLTGVAKGDRGPWERLADPSLLYASEDNRVFTRVGIMAQIEPLPKGVSATIVPTQFNVVDHGKFAVTTYVAEEHPTFYGQRVPSDYRVTDTWAKTAVGWRLVASEVFAIPYDPPAVALSAAVLRGYVGRYQLTDGKFYTVSIAGVELRGQRNGHPAETLLPEADSIFFVRGNPRYRKVFLRDATGKVTALGERREGRDLVWKRID